MKRYCLTLKNDKKFLSKEFTDSINDTAFCDGDVVVVCEKCNAIMHESCWIENGNLCGLCEGTELKDINRKFIQYYIPNEKKGNRNIKNNTINDFHVEDTSSNSHSKKNKKKTLNFKPFLLTILILASIILVLFSSMKNSIETKNNTTAGIYESYNFEDQPIAPDFEELTISPIENNEITIDDAFSGDSIAISEETPKSYSGYISENHKTNEYIFKTPRSGIYNFSIEDIMATATARIKVFDNNDNCIIDTHNNSAYEELAGNTDYRIVISQSSGESDFKLVIGIQKKKVDISRTSTIYDQVSFKNQKNKYSFTAPISGIYRFDITESNANNSFRLMMWDDKDNNISDTYNDGFYEELDGGKTYEIQVRQSTGIGNYCLKVGFQKPTTDVTGYTKVVDSIEYTDQKNIYNFTPNITGRYRFDITETNANNSYRLTILDHLDNIVGETYNSGISLDLEKNEIYEIQIRQNDGFDSYSFLIGYQKEKEDISDCELVYDSLEFRDQINYYKYIASQSAEYNLSLTNFDSNCSFRIIIFDEYNNVLADTYSENVFVNLEAKKEYTIEICQESGFSNYTLRNIII